MVGYFEEFLLKRQANATNVFLVETYDPKRIHQFKQLILQSAHFRAHRKLFYDLQSKELIDFETGAPAQDFSSPTKSFFGVPESKEFLMQLLSLLRGRPTVLLISYLFERFAHTLNLNDFLVAASHDPMLYRLKSTIVVFTSDAGLFPQAVRRLVYTLSPPPSLPEERETVLRSIASELSQTLGRDLKLTIDADIISASSGLTLHDVETAALESFAANRDFRVEAFTQYKIKLLRVAGLEYVQPSRGFESVGGYEYLKSYIMNRVVKVLRNPDITSKYGLGIPRGILLYGPPGTGKTWFAKALAKEVGLPMVIIDPSTFLRGIVGETEARVKQITQIIESLAPVVVFIDEFDQLTLSRQAVMPTDSGVTRRMTNMLLSWLGNENRESFVVGATNTLSDVDSAFLRPGRLDEVIPVLYPDMRAREEILRVHTSIVRKVPMKDVDLRAIAERTWLWTGAELEKLVLEAATLAMLEGAEAVTQRHFEDAMVAIEVNTAEREQKLKNMIQELGKLENVNRSLLRSALNFFMQSEVSRVKGVIG
uniref:ATP-binding protein n=1 Tax=Thermofilum adornatum TaxID=1365176 RepID=A0A7C1GAW3_9CREN